MKIGATTTPQTAEILSWDSEFWNIRTAQAHHPDVDKWAAENTVGMLWLLVNADDPERIQEAEDHGWRYMDTRVELVHQPSEANFSFAATRSYRDDDLQALVEIARSAHRITRFYADPHLPDSRCDDLYEAWIRNSCAGWAQGVFIGGGSGRPLGYVTVHEGDPTSLGLIAVAEDARSKGVGRALVARALDWSEDVPMKVVTQGRNVEAQRLFQRCGFRTTKTELWFHRWMDDATT